MNKSDIVKILAQKMELTEKDALSITNVIVDEIGQALYLGDKVEFRGFGVFFSKYREERIARNPKTGEKLTIDRKKILQFKMAKSFYEHINQ